MTKFVLRLAEYLGPKLGVDAQLQQRKGLWGPLLIIIGFLGCFLAIGYASYQFKIKPLVEIKKPLLPIDDKQWSIWFASDLSDCSASVYRVEPSCPAHPQNTSIWDSSWKPSDSDLQGRIDGRVNKDIWYGLTLTTEQIQEAKKAGALYLYVGWISGTYHIWFNGRLVDHGASDFRFYPVIPTLPLGEALKEQSNHLAIQIIHDSGRLFPMYLNYPIKTGWLSYKEKTAVLEYNLLINRQVPLLTAAFSMFFTLSFFLFWLTNTQRREYFYLACWLGVMSISQLFSLDYFIPVLPAIVYARLWLLVTYALAISGLLFGLTCARLPQSMLRTTMFSLAFFAVISVVTSFPLPLGNVYVLKGFAQKWLVPAFFVTGGLACWLQSFALYQRGLYAWAKFRYVQLNTIGFLLVFVGWNYYAQSALGSSITNITPYLHVMSIYLVVMALGVILIYIYRGIEIERQKVPQSKFHKVPYLNQPIHGVLIGFDLRKSEWLHIIKSFLAEETNLVIEWRNQMISRLQQEGVIYIQSKGDEVFGFINSTDFESPLDKAFEVLAKLDEESIFFTESARARGLVEDYQFLFKAALVEGSLKPMLSQIDDKFVPDWEEAESTTPFIDCGRMMSFKNSSLDKESSFLVLSQENLNKLKLSQVQRQNVVGENLNLQEKEHSTQLQVALMEIPRHLNKKGHSFSMASVSA